MSPKNIARLLCLAGTAFAAPHLSTAAWANDANSQPAQSQDRVILGVGGAYVPGYQGSDDYRLLPFPVIDIVKGPFFANLRNGIGINITNTGPLTIGTSVAVTRGYRSKDAPEGIGKLSLGAGGRVFARVSAAGLIGTLGATKGFAGGTKGIVADASLSYPLAISPRLSLIPGVATTWADRKHNDRYFGIDTRQSLASGLPEYHAGSGFKDASALLVANYRVTDRLNLSASAGVSTLLGDAKDSPIVEHKTQPVGFLSLSYRLGS